MMKEMPVLFLIGVIIDKDEKLFAEIFRQKQTSTLFTYFYFIQRRHFLQNYNDLRTLENTLEDKNTLKYVKKSIIAKDCQKARGI